MVSCGILFGQAQRLPYEQARCEGRLRHEAVRPCSGGTQHRDPVRELQPGKGPRRASELGVAGSFNRELRLADISDIDAGSAFLPEFVERFNEKFALPPAKAENLHRRLNVQVSNLADILCHREQRHLSQQLALAYDRRQIILERSELADKLAGQYVDVYDFADWPLEVRWKGHSLPYRVFSKDQRQTRLQRRRNPC
jgi:hypothetical protein